MHSLDFDDFISIDPKRLALWELERCRRHLSEAYNEELALLDAVRASYCALQASLVHVLSGTAGVGALSDDDASAMLGWLEEPVGSPPRNYLRVMPFQNLLKAAQAGGVTARLEHPRLTLSLSDEALLKRLRSLRDNLEHPKDVVESIEVAYLVQPLIPAARVTRFCLEHPRRRHQLSEAKAGSLASIEAAIISDASAVLTGGWRPAAW